MRRLHGLYAITPEVPGAHLSLAKQVEQAIAGGARVIQYRDKSNDPDKRLHEAGSLQVICQATDVPLIINDELDLAVRVGAAGVHLGRKDADPLKARRQLGRRAIIGVSCYDELQRAVHAQEIGADYAAFGRFFPSMTKPQAVQASFELLRQARKRLTIPLVAIGGITAENGRSLILAGADMLAVIDALFGQANIRATAAAFNELFRDGENDQ